MSCGLKCGGTIGVYLDTLTKTIFRYIFIVCIDFQTTSLYVRNTTFTVVSYNSLLHGHNNKSQKKIHYFKSQWY